MRKRLEVQYELALWEHSGMSQTELIDRLIQLALERHDREKKMKTSFEL